MISTSTTMLLAARRYIISLDPWCLGNYWLDSDRLPRNSRSTGGPAFRHFAPYLGGLCPKALGVARQGTVRVLGYGQKPWRGNV